MGHECSLHFAQTFLNVWTSYADVDLWQKNVPWVVITLVLTLLHYEYNYMHLIWSYIHFFYISNMIILIYIKVDVSGLRLAYIRPCSMLTSIVFIREEPCFMHMFMACMCQKLLNMCLNAWLFMLQLKLVDYWW